MAAAASAAAVATDAAGITHEAATGVVAIGVATEVEDTHHIDFDE